jgi:hypothetical protein
MLRTGRAAEAQRAKTQPAKSDKRLGFLRFVETYGNIYPLSGIERVQQAPQAPIAADWRMRGMVCVTGGEGCGDTGPGRVQEG